MRRPLQLSSKLTALCFHVVPASWVLQTTANQVAVKQVAVDCKCPVAFLLEFSH